MMFTFEGHIYVTNQLVHTEVPPFRDYPKGRSKSGLSI